MARGRPVLNISNNERIRRRREQNTASQRRSRSRRRMGVENQNNSTLNNTEQNDEAFITVEYAESQHVESEIEIRRRGRPRLTDCERRERQRIRNVENQRDEDNLELPNLNVRSRTRRLRRSLYVCAGGEEFNDNHNPHYIGEMNFECIHCSAKHFEGEKVSNKGFSFHLCCQHGKVRVDPPPAYPDELQLLFQLTSFRNNIRLYNNIHSFASFNANIVDLSSIGRGPISFIIQGQVYYAINTALRTTEGSSPQYGQIFIIDSQNAIEYRNRTFMNLDREIISKITRVLNEINLHAKAFQMFHQEYLIEQESHTPQELFLHFGLKEGTDIRRYNLRQCNEVAAIFATNEDGDIPDSFVTIYDKAIKKLRNVSFLNPNVDPWIYPLLFPYGTPGWNINMKLQNSNKRLTRNAYVKYKLRIVDGEFSPILNGCKLFQQFLVDSYLRIEKERIEFIIHNQKLIRSERYDTVIQALNTNAHDYDSRIGRMIILPSTFVGSPRYMQQNYLDAMTIVNKYGKPDIFLTMTCNPKWKEITENLLENQKPSDRPDLIVRVFCQKINYLIDLVTKKSFFGICIAWVYTIEFQKRGLPHIHLLLTLSPEYKLRNSDVIDRYISAELPDPNLYPQVRKLVTENMLHGPCGPRCLINFKCSKRFPKVFQEETIIEDDSYPKYRRRNNGDFTVKNGVLFDNKNVVPYSPLLISLLQCHINVEIASNISSIKYIYKYIFKGFDKASFRIDEHGAINYNECETFADSRYVGSCEAAWRIFGFPIHDKSHTIIRLPIHLPNQQSINFVDNADEEAIRNILERETMLMDYFELNKRDSQAKNLLYHHIPENYVWRKVTINSNSVYRWEKRQSHFNIIGRMHTVSPTNQELFHMRVLLTHVKGAESFEDLRKVNGVIQQTFTRACIELGLVEDDEEWDRVMREASLSVMPYQLRVLFTSILVNCSIAYPERLWENYKILLSEDFARENPITAEARAYHEISNLLIQQGLSLADFPLLNQNVLSIDDIIAYDPQQDLLIADQGYVLLNEGQKTIIDRILEVVENSIQIQKCFYIDGPGGSGKTFVYKILWHKLRGIGKKVKTMAFTGIAAILLPEGKTVHKTFGLPVPLYRDSTSTISPQSKEAKELIETDVFIWDECPMAPKYALEIMDKLLRYLTNNSNVPFGGKIVIIGGDFRQLLPVRKNGTKSECIDLSIKNSYTWKFFEIHYLTQNMRATESEGEFAKYVLRLGEGKDNDEFDNVEIDSDYFIETNLVHAIYNDYFLAGNFEAASNSVILSARNSDVNLLNEEVIDMLNPSTEKIYTSIDSVKEVHNDELRNALTQDYLNNLNPVSLPPHTLRLRINTVVMLIRNLNIEEGLCNGTRVLIIQLMSHIIVCKILTGDKSGNIVFLHRIPIDDTNSFSFIFTRKQFPIKPAFAMTINKSQGQTFDKVGLDLRKDVFSHGQLYVGLSRARSKESVKIYLGNQRRSNKIKNIVYREIINS